MQLTADGSPLNEVKGQSGTQEPWKLVAAERRMIPTLCRSKVHVAGQKGQNNQSEQFSFWRSHSNVRERIGKFFRATEPWHDRHNNCKITQSVVMPSPVCMADLRTQVMWLRMLFVCKRRVELWSWKKAAFGREKGTTTASVFWHQAVLEPIACGSFCRFPEVRAPDGQCLTKQVRRQRNV